MVTTPIGLDGIDAVVGKDVAAASDVDGFISEIVRLLADSRESRAALGDSGRKLVENRYSWPANIRRIESLVLGS